MERVSGPPTRPTPQHHHPLLQHRPHRLLPTATVPRLGRTGERPRLVKPNKEETLVRVTQVVSLSNSEIAPEEE